MEIKAVIFDLDGVIVSTDSHHYRAWKQIADEEGIYFDEVINNRLRGVSRMESLDIVLEKAHRFYTPDEKSALADRKNSIYVGLLTDLTPKAVLPGVSEVLSALRQNGIRTAIGSSSKNAKLILERIGMTGVFDAIADGTEIERSKPFPDVFLKAAAKLGTPPETCLVVEDAVAGIHAAKAAGMTAAAIGDACGSDDTDLRLEKLTDLIKAL